jgi:hypothetical protein
MLHPYGVRSIIKSPHSPVSARMLLRRLRSIREQHLVPVWISLFPGARFDHGTGFDQTLESVVPLPFRRPDSFLEFLSRERFGVAERGG